MKEGPLKTQEITAGPVFGDISYVVSREHREGHLALQETVVAEKFCHVLLSQTVLPSYVPWTKCGLFVYRSCTVCILLLVYRGLFVDRHHLT